MLLLDGKKLASEIKEKLASFIKSAASQGCRPPGLAVILAGDDAASRIYVKNKQKACAETGINSFPFTLSAETSCEEILKLIKKLNSQEDVDGILLQLPLPAGLNADLLISAIDPEKDVDGFHPVNIGRLCAGLDGFVPCTPAGIIEITRHYGLSLDGKKAVVIGRSNIVGKPLAMLLAKKENNATVTLCHSGTKNLEKECLSADFLFLAMGKPKAITGDMIREGCVVIDAGINRTQHGICGDADFESAALKASAITPVPGGVGPMTIAMLLENTVKSWQKRIKF